ncbi:NUDIX hydrolase [Lysinibacillus sp. JNUCC 51]|uniref:hypothetical protein n=1 Tax=Lysinibacillus sp. JNUCC-51 TaxID=2792479 RepID=UPI0030816496
MKFIPSDEGELFWVPKNELSDLYTSKIINLTIQHYLNNKNIDDIFVGTMMNNNESKSEIHWSTIKETAGF